jgi:hypothetical protein
MTIFVFFGAVDVGVIQSRTIFDFFHRRGSSVEKR